MVSVNGIITLSKKCLPNAIKGAGGRITAPCRLLEAPKSFGIAPMKSLATDVVELSQPQGFVMTESLEKAIEKYNNKKFADASKWSASEEILKNWKPEYATKNTDGVYQNAIDFLTKEGGALDTYLIEGFPKMNSETRANAKKLLTSYLKENLDIYTYERIEGILKKFSKEIKQSGKNPILYIPDDEKSYNIIAELYKKINPNVETVTGYNNLIEYAKTHPNTNIAVLDDCLMSGKSVRDIYEGVRKKCPNIKDIDFYACTACEKGVNQLKEIPDLGIHYDGKLKKALEDSDFYKNLTIYVNGKPKDVQQSFFRRIAMFKKENTSMGSAIMFPYMSPNNNTIFSAKMIEQIFNGPRRGIKLVDRYKVDNGEIEYPPRWLKVILDI